MLKNVERGRPQITGACTLHAGCQRLQTHSSCVLLNIAFPLQQWLHEIASVIRNTYITSLITCHRISNGNKHRKTSIKLKLVLIYTLFLYTSMILLENIHFASNNFISNCLRHIILFIFIFYYFHTFQAFIYFALCVYFSS